MISSCSAASSARPADVLGLTPLVAVGDVLRDGAGEDERLLADVADQPADVLARHGLQRHAAQHDRPPHGCVSRSSTLQPGRFAAARPAGHADRLAVADRQRHPVQGATDLAVGRAVLDRQVLHDDDRLARLELRLGGV